METPKILYHGTCRAFIVLAQQKEGKFGPDYDKLSFTPDFNHAKTLAESWKEPRGKKILEDYFGKGLPEELHAPVILKFNSISLGELYYDNDALADEFYLEKGPIDISIVEEYISP